MAEHKQLLDSLHQKKNVQFLSLYDLSKDDKNRHAIQCGLRYDITQDLDTAKQSARHLARYGIPSSFYLSQVAPYYGTWERGHFTRNPTMEKAVIDLIVAGCEIGLHIDPRAIVATHGGDVTQAIKDDIAWLRSFGIPAKGFTCSTNYSIPFIQGFEFFKELKQQGKPPLSDPYVSLQEQLSMKELGLTYEGTFAKPLLQEEQIPSSTSPLNSTPNEGQMYSLLHENPFYSYTTDWQIWPISHNHWCFSLNRDHDKRFFFDINSKEMLALLDKQLLGTRGIINLSLYHMKGE